MKYFILGMLFFVTVNYGQEKIVIREDFNTNRNGWNTTPKSKEFKVNIEKGFLHLEKLHKNFDNRGCLWYSKEFNNFDTSKNFSIVVKAKRVSGGDFTNVLDIQWGVSGESNIKGKAMLYQLNIFIDGAVRLDFYQKKWDNFSKVSIKNKLDEIGFDPTANNSYEVLQEDGFVSLKINDIEVYKQYVFPIEGNAIGFQHCLKGAWDIDKIAITQLSPIVKNIENTSAESERIKTVNDTIIAIVDNKVDSVSVISEPVKDQGLRVFKKEELVIYPNPFNEAFNVQFNLDKEGAVIFYLFNINGQLMKTETKYFQKGDISFLMEASVPNGVYIVRVVTENNSNLYKKIMRVGS